MLKLIISKIVCFFRTIAPIPCYLGIDPCVKFIKHSSVKSGNRKEIPLELHILSAQTSFSKPELWSEYRCIHAVSCSHKLVVKRSGFVPVWTLKSLLSKHVLKTPKFCKIEFHFLLSCSQLIYIGFKMQIISFQGPENALLTYCLFVNLLYLQCLY